MDNTTRASTKAAYAAAGVKVLVSRECSTLENGTSAFSDCVFCISIRKYGHSYDIRG